MRLRRLRLRSGDSLTVVDNRPESGMDEMDGSAATHGRSPRVLPARERQSSYFARNRGAEQGAADWIVFIDADVEPAEDLLDRYFDEPPGDEVGILAGAINDEGPRNGERQTAAARYAFLRRAMDHHTTKAQLGPFAKTANAAVRRRAFDDLGGFVNGIRSGGDVDMAYRLRSAGWRLEYRPQAAVTHRGRRTVLALLRQQARHGAGTQWLDRRYPGFSPPYRWSSLLASLLRGGLRGALAKWNGDYDRFLTETLDPLTALAFHLGRFAPNRVRASRRHERRLCTGARRRPA